MTTIPSAIASLLYDHDTVIVPGLGAFVRHDQSAQVNVITNEFQCPSSTVSFDPQQREENSLISTFLMACDGCSDEEARTTIVAFVNDCYNRIKEEGSVTLPDLGVLGFDDQHDLVFEAMDKANFNTDAFGLNDFTPQPVFGTENGERKTENGERNGVSSHRTEGGKTEKDEVEESREKRGRRWWIWVLLLLLAAAGVALWYFKFRPVPTKPWTYDLKLPERPVPVIQRSDTLVRSQDRIEEPTQENTAEQPPAETPDSPSVDAPVTPVEIIVPEATSKAFIVGGCFEIEQYALNMANGAKEKGCADVFVMKRGNQYLVCYGQYPTTADAKAALPEILANYNEKAWILTK